MTNLNVLKVVNSLVKENYVDITILEDGMENVYTRKANKEDNNYNTVLQGVKIKFTKDYKRYGNPWNRKAL